MYSAPVWWQFNSNIETAFQTITFINIGRRVFSQQINTFHMILFRIVKCIGDGVCGGVLSEKNGLNGVKSCNFRQDNMKMHFYESHESFMMILEKGWRSMPFELGSDKDFKNIYSKHNTGERSKPGKIEHLWTPSPSTQDSTSDKSQGGLDPSPHSPTLNPRIDNTRLILAKHVSTFVYSYRDIARLLVPIFACIKWGHVISL